jgi:hypothetical protein
LAPRIANFVLVLADANTKTGAVRSRHSTLFFIRDATIEPIAA